MLSKKISAVLVGVIAAMGLMTLAVVPTNVSAQTDTTYDYDYTYDTTPLTEAEQEQAAAFGTGFFLITGCVTVLFYVYGALALATMGKKVGETQTWMAWVPLANIYYMTKVAGLPAYWMVISIVIPFAYLYVYMKIAERRGFPNWYGLLLLVPVVGLFIPAYLAWGEPKK